MVVEKSCRPDWGQTKIIAEHRLSNHAGRLAEEDWTHHLEAIDRRQAVKRKTLGWFVRFGSWLNFFLTGRF